MADHTQIMREAIRTGTVFDTGLLARLDAVISATPDNEGFVKLREHVSLLFASIPDRLTVINRMLTGVEIDLYPYIGSILGKGDEAIAVATETGFPAGNAAALALVENETEAYEAALAEIEAQALALELNELLKDPLGAVVLAAIGGPAVQAALVAERQEFLDRYGLGGEDEDDGSVIGDEDDDCPCC